MWFLGCVSTLLWRRQTFRALLAQITNVPNGWNTASRCCWGDFILVRAFNRASENSGDHRWALHGKGSSQQTRESLLKQDLSGTSSACRHGHVYFTSACTHTHADMHMQRYIYTHIFIHAYMAGYIYTRECVCIYDWLLLCLCIYNLLCSAVFLTFVMTSIICGLRRLSHEMW